MEILFFILIVLFGICMGYIFAEIAAYIIEKYL